MGKSDKKAKSDKINILRKQYDAFMEEDKRRKERNEDILKKIDNMRACDKVVPYRTKMQDMAKDISLKTHRHFINVSNSYKDFLISQPQTRPYTSSKSNIIIDETVLNEISKNYILIPRLQHSDQAIFAELIENAQPSLEDPNWKSKYDILAKLKQSEKDELNTQDKYPNNENINKDIHSDHVILEENKNPENDSIISSQPSSALQNDRNADNNLAEQSNEDLPTIDSENTKRHFENILLTENLSNNNEMEDNSITNDSDINHSEENRNFVRPDNIHVSNIADVGDCENNLVQNSDYYTQDTTQYYNGTVYDLSNSVNENFTGYQNEPIYKEGNSQNHTADVDKYSHDETAYNKDNFGNNTVNENIATDYLNYTAMAQDTRGITNDSNSNENEQDSDVNTHNEQIIKPNIKIEFDNNDLPKSDSNLQESNVILEENTVSYSTEKESGIEDHSRGVMDMERYIDPTDTEYQQQTEVVDNTAALDHEASIEDFEAEQKMFYSDTNQFVQYREGEVYNQLQDKQDESYLQDEEYNAHYDTVLTDGAYSVEVNDDEQVLQRYDQSYEQQFKEEFVEDGQQPVQYDDQQQPYENQYMYQNEPSEDQQLYENPHYEGQNYEIQQQNEPQTFVDQKDYNQKQYEQQLSEDLTDIVQNANEAIFNQPSIERQLDREEGLLQTQK